MIGVMGVAAVVVVMVGRCVGDLERVVIEVARFVAVMVLVVMRMRQWWWRLRIIEYQPFLYPR